MAKIAESFLPNVPRRVINATGIILHTNLGRAPLSERAVAATAQASGFTDLEYDLAAGERSSRQDHVEPLLNVLLGCEASMMVTNNAAAILLALSATASGKEVVVSRGQAVEIGNGFRIPTILRQSRAKMIEVGTTNRTSVEDYAEAITQRTAAFLHVHASNFKIIGFTQQALISELAEAARRSSVLLLVDNGSGALIDTADYGLPREPRPADAVAEGADLVMFSTDKLLGGPQGGVIAGRRVIVEALRKHPLARVLRPDKMAIAALAATLGEYATGDVTNIPVIAMLSRSVTELRTRADVIQKQLKQDGWIVSIQEGESLIGGGSLPGETLPSVHVVLEMAHPTSFVGRMRALPQPIIPTIRGRRIVLDLRTVAPEQDQVICSQLLSLYKS